jgi:hypothetical protein
MILLVVCLMGWDSIADVGRRIRFDLIIDILNGTVCELFVEKDR